MITITAMPIESCWTRGFVSFAIVSVAACGPGVVRVGPLAPEPALRLATQPHAVALRAAGPTTLRAPAVSSMPAVELQGVQQTLQTGFERGFGAAAARADAGSERILELELKELSFITHRAARRPDAARIVLVHGGPEHRPLKRMPRRRFARISFDARVLDSAARVLGQLSGDAVANVPAGRDADSIGASIESAVAVMYEQIAQRLFTSTVAFAPGKRRGW